MKVCPECKTQLVSRYRCPKCGTVFRTEREYKNSLYLIFGFFILIFVLFVFLGMTIEWGIICIWFISPFIIWFFMWIVTERINSYDDLELKWLGDKTIQL